MAYIRTAHNVLPWALLSGSVFRPAVTLPLEDGREGIVQLQETPVPSQTTSLLRRAAESNPHVPECVLGGQCLGVSCQTLNDCENDSICSPEGWCIEVDEDTRLREASTSISSSLTSPPPSRREPSVLSTCSLIIDPGNWPTPTSLDIQIPSMSSSPSSTFTANANSGGLDSSATIGLAVAVPFSVITIFGALIIVLKARRRRKKQENSFRYPPFDKISSPQSTIIHRLADTDGALEVSRPRPPRFPMEVRNVTYIPITKPNLIYYPTRSTPNRTRMISPNSARATTPSDTSRAQTPNSHTPLRPGSRTPEMMEKPRIANPPPPPPPPPPKDEGHSPRRPLAPRRLRSSPAGLYTLNLVEGHNSEKVPMPQDKTPQRPPRRPSIHKMASSPDVRTNNLAALRPLSPAARLPTTPELPEPGMRPPPLRTRQSHQNLEASSFATRSSARPPRDLTRSTYKSTSIAPLNPTMKTYPVLQNTPATPLNFQHSPSIHHPVQAELEGCDAQQHLPSYRHTRLHHPDEANDMLSNYNTPSWRPNFAPTPTPTPPPGLAPQEVPVRMARDAEWPIPDDSRDDSPTLPRHISWFNARGPSPLGRVVGAVRSASVKSSNSLTRTLSRNILRRKLDEEAQVGSHFSDSGSPPMPPPPSCPVSPETGRGEIVPIKHSPVSALTPDGRQVAWPAVPGRRGPHTVFEEVEDEKARAELQRRMKWQGRK